MNCLKTNHNVENCQSEGRCLVCGGKHHTRLHQDKASYASSGVSTPGPTTRVVSRPAESSNCCTASGRRTALLATACVTLQSSDGNQITVRALLDSGAEESFISEHVAQALSLRKQPRDVVISGIGGSAAAIAKGSVKLILKSRHTPNFTLNFSALVLKRLTAVVPNAEVPVQSWSELETLPLADPHFHTPGRIDCILNSEVYADVIRPGIKRGPPGTYTALQTVFGWVILRSTSNCSESRSHAALYTTHVDHELTQAVTRFWETEEVPTSIYLSPEDEACVDQFRRSHFCNSEGRFVVRLPFSKPPTLQGSQEIAAACLNRLVRRFNKDHLLHQSYNTFMKEYEDLHHMEVVSSDEVNESSCFYLPHHPVFKRDDANKIRVVFNASQRVKNGFSLNSFLCIGPKLQEDVVAIIVRWCFFSVVFTCDVVKMFRQFLVHPDDQDWQRILFRPSSSDPVQTYKLLTVTYGTACAPFLANACMLRLAEDERSSFPKAADILQYFRYADDFFAGGDTFEAALEARNQLIGILGTAGMQVGKWATNDPELLSDLGLLNEKAINLDDPDVFCTLGLRWNSAKDAFGFQISSLDENRLISKRSILSKIARFYYPMGWLSPVIIRCKILLQNLWLQGVSWDDPVPVETREAWLSFRQQLVDLEKLTIPRWFYTFNQSVWHLHAFCDASERAFAASIYIVVDHQGKLHSRLMVAKSKVAPVKVISLPKLELCGASLLVKLISYLLPKLKNPPTSISCWTDSNVVLSWLRSHPSRWKSFVANRVSEIVTSLPDATWKHVKSCDNPADLATRGITPTQLSTSTLWWEGPSWLGKPDSEWPKSVQDSSHTEFEARKGYVTHNFMTQTTEELSGWLTKFSSFDKLVRILGYIQRWRLNSKLRVNDRRVGWLTALELAAGRSTLLRIVQLSAFIDDIKALVSKGEVSNSSPLRRLSPFLDRDGLLRVGGRLQNSFLSESERHPIILPCKHNVTALLIRKAHIITLHGGPSLVQGHLAREYWIVRSRNFIRQIVRSCICTRFRATPLIQQMAPLPAVRCRPERPFSHTGVDYIGPFLIKASPGRGQKCFKGYIAIFICLVVRAIHLEVVSDYTSAAFLAAFRRFTARRGLCKVIFSDNGTTFQGADSELRRLFAQTSAMSQEIAAQLASDNIEWSYIPPRAPNFGGLWEANVKAFKQHFRRVVGDAKLTYEELSTVVSMIEACLNSRPISLITSNEEDVAPLTPGHFLIGSSLIAPPEPFIDVNHDNTVCSRWRMLTLMRNHFWKRWYREVLTQLQQRSKWLHPNRSFAVGDIVLFKDELQPPTKWPLARITRLFPGRDGLSRVAMIKTAYGDYKRPINKLILLPINDAAQTFLLQFHRAMAGGNADEEIAEEVKMR